MTGADPVSLLGLELKPEYNTEDDDIVRDFDAPCLLRSFGYDRAVGYFRAGIYRELGIELLEFVQRGGRVRIVCSPDIPVEVEDAARRGYAGRGVRSEQLVEADLTLIMKVMAADPDERDCLEMLRILVEHGSLELFIAMRPVGIYHRKTGAFSDQAGNRVVFSGSGNETAPAVSRFDRRANDEEFDVFRSWGDPFESAKVRVKYSYLQDLIAGKSRHTRVRPLNQVESDYLQSFRSLTTLEECRPGAEIRSRGWSRFSPVQPYFFQRLAVDAWKRADCNGILAMATGTGKTITALFAIRSLVEAGLPILIVVPSRLLMEQWQRAIQVYYPGVPILLVGAGNDWKAEPHRRSFVVPPPHPRVILATMQTACSEDFLEFLGQAKEVALVADEAHRLGSERNRRLLDLPFIARLGLSATPERLFDPEGNLALAKAFGENPVFDLPLGGRVRISPGDDFEVPIIGRFLSPYRYDFVSVDLNEKERKQWIEFTKEIRRIMARGGGRTKEEVLSEPTLQNLLIRRARIAKKAEGKVDAAIRIVEERYPPSGRWIVYCDDLDQLNAVSDRIRSRNPTLAVINYHSQMSEEERDAALRAFTETPSLIVSIRCLDEGVDIPAADGGIILASSTNPREYVQRRGRLLRKAVGKFRSEIIDVLVLPERDGDGSDPTESLVRSELARAYSFSRDAENPEVSHRLWQICQEYNVDLLVDSPTGLEPDGED